MAILLQKPQGGGRQMSAELEEFIRGAIQRGELKPGERLGSAKQLATRWKASYGAVRQSLETLAAKGLVERRARAGTFVASDPDVATVKTGSRNIIGLLVPDIRMPEYSLVARHLQDAGHNADFEVLVSSTDNERERYDQSVLRHLRAGVGGLVLVAPQQARISLQTLLEIEKSGVPAVNYAKTLDVVPWPTVQTDVFQATYLPVRHLCELGRKRIGFLSYPASQSTGTQMRYGLYRAIAEFGLSAADIVEFEVPDHFYLSSWTDRASLGQIINAWLDANPQVDAICCMHDHIASTVLTALAQRGVRVPDDVAVTGHGGYGMREFFGLAPGELTSVDTSIAKAAAEMVRVLQGGPQQGETKGASVIAIQPELIIGRSTVAQGGTAPPN
jgi:LacI family transcriptional regulator